MLCRQLQKVQHIVWLGKKSLKFNGLFDELTPILLRINKRPEEVT